MYIFQTYIEYEQIYRFLGILGFLTYVSGYTILSIGWYDTRSISYFIVNLTASFLVCLGLIADFNISSLLIQVFYFTISVIAIAMRLRQRFTQNKNVLSPVTKQS